MIVVAALIHKQNKILIARRKTGTSDVLGKWEFPGGKVESNETESEALKREIKEELNLYIKVNNLIAQTFINDKMINLKLYDCEYLSGEVRLEDHFEYQWIDLKTIFNYSLAPADYTLANTIIEKEYK